MPSQKLQCGDCPTSPASARSRRTRQFALKALLATYIGCGLSFAAITARILVVEEPPESIGEEPRWGPLPDVFLCAEDFEPEFHYSKVQLEAGRQPKKLYSIVSDGLQAFWDDVPSAIASDPIGLGGTCVSWRTSAMAPTGLEWNEVRLSTSFLRPIGSPTSRLSLRLVGAASEGGTVYATSPSVDSYNIGSKGAIENSFTLHKTWTEWEHMIGHERIGMVTADPVSKKHVDRPPCPSKRLNARKGDEIDTCDGKLEVADIVVTLNQQLPQVRFFLGKDIRIFRLATKVGIVLALVTFGYLASVILPRLMPNKRSRHSDEIVADKLEVGPDLVE